jgi:hypothetical protein
MRSALAMMSTGSSIGASPLAVRAALIAGSPLLHLRATASRNSPARARPRALRGGVRPSPIAGTPHCGIITNVMATATVGSPSAAAPIRTPGSMWSATTTSAGRRSSSARVSAANSAAGPQMRLSRTLSISSEGELLGRLVKPP